MSGSLVARDLCRDFGPVTALRPISVRVSPGEQVAVVGPSGAGKSTLLHLLAALDRPTAGEVSFAGQNYDSTTDEQLASLRRRHFGFVFQSGRLIPYLNCVENVALPALLNGTSRKAALERARNLLEELGVGQVAERRPATLSGGEAQRVAIARAVSHAPAVVFADEPTGNLDSDNAEVVAELLLASTDQHTLVLVTHDVNLAGRLARQIRLEDGEVVEDTAASSTTAPAR